MPEKTPWWAAKPIYNTNVEEKEKRQQMLREVRADVIGSIARSSILGKKDKKELLRDMQVRKIADDLTVDERFFQRGRWLDRRRSVHDIGQLLAAENWANTGRHLFLSPYHKALLRNDKRKQRLMGAK